MIQPTRGATSRRRRAFTLVELITAAGLMMIMMVGVVEIFQIATRTAGEAETASFAQQQLRGVFDHLHRDIRGMAREGYLQIGGDVGGEGSATAGDTLAFVSIGNWNRSTFESSGSEEYAATAAEVMYTTNVRYAPPEMATGYNRNGTSSPLEFFEGHGLPVLGRGLWLVCGEAGDTGSLGDLDIRSNAPWLANLTHGTTERRTMNTVVVYPWTKAGGVSAMPETLRRIMATAITDFHVESFDGENFSHGFSAESYTDGTWPRALRITATVRDPDADRDDEEARFSLQEVILIGDP